jgi:hypothetical protein
MNEDLEKELNLELVKDFPPETLKSPLRSMGALNRPLGDRMSQDLLKKDIVQATTPSLVRLSEALAKIEALAAALERAESDARKQLEIVQKSL